VGASVRELLIYAFGVATGVGASLFSGFLGYRLAQQHNAQRE